MKQIKIFHRFVAILLLTTFSYTFMKTEAQSWPKKSFGIGWNYSTLKQGKLQKLNSSLGITLSTTRTYYVTKPTNIARLGIDVVFGELSFTKYEVEFRKEPKRWNENLIGIDFCPQVGISLAIQHVKSLSIIPFARYTPNFHLYHAENENTFAYSFAGITAGLRVLYKFIGCGFDYQMNSFDLKPLYGDGTLLFDGPKEKNTNQGLRAYIFLNF